MITNITIVIITSIILMNMLLPERRVCHVPRACGATHFHEKIFLRTTRALFLAGTRPGWEGLNHLPPRPNRRTKANKAHKANRANRANMANREENHYVWTEDHNSTETIPSGTPF